MVHAHKRYAALDQPPGENAIAAELAVTVSLKVFCRLLGDVKQIARVQ